MTSIAALKYSQYILSVVILLQCIGVFFLLQSGSAVEGMLFMDYGLPQSSSMLIENIVSFLFLSLGILVIIRPFRIILALLALMFFLLAFIIWQQAGSPFTQFTLFAHSARILLSVSFIFLLKDGLLYKKLAYYLLALGLSITFITHGLESISLHPYFIDYLITSAKKLLDLDLQEAMAGTLLTVIGTLDVLVGVAILFVRNKWLFVWMAAWGCITALARITELGWGMFPEVLARAVHFGGPIALIFLNRCFKANPRTRNFQRMHSASKQLH